MIVRENVPLAPLSTLGVGGAARFFIDVENESECREAVHVAQEHGVRWYVLGNGSNILVPDAGVQGVVMHMRGGTVEFVDEGDTVLAISDAGFSWNELVDMSTHRHLYGIENLAGIPGTLGGATVQNIGAYGAELSETFAYADCLDGASGTTCRVDVHDAQFAYRSSVFKNKNLIITRVALRLKKNDSLHIEYADITRMHMRGMPLTTPAEVAQAVRIVRAGKFPAREEEGTAGSFFKNPVISKEEAFVLKERFSDMPQFPQSDGMVKISLAWILDNVLHINGYARGYVRAYEKQPLVLIATHGATARDVDLFAKEIAEKVFLETHIHIEREVEMFGE